MAKFYPKTMSCLYNFGLSAIFLAISIAFCPTVQATPATLAHSDLVVVVKSKRKLYLYRDRDLIKTFDIQLGKSPLGRKQKRGDQKTPEGRYRLNWRNKNSHYHRAIHISYPSPADRNIAAKKGLDPGDYIMIHGQPNDAPFNRYGDWTDGCIALTNHDMDILWDNVADGTPIIIYP